MPLGKTMCIFKLINQSSGFRHQLGSFFGLALIVFNRACSQHLSAAPSFVSSQDSTPSSLSVSAPVSLQFAAGEHLLT